MRESDVLSIRSLLASCRFSSRVVVAFVGLSIPLLGVPPPLHAQGQFLGAIHGTVKDEQGGVLPGVVVTVVPTKSRPTVTTITNAEGLYSIKDLEPGEYAVKAELSGFAELLQPGVQARAGLTLSLDLVMKVGGIGEVVTVRRDAPLLESKSAATSVNISGEFQRAIPLTYRRDWADFLYVTPGVVSTVGSPIDTNFSLHGAYVSSNVVQIDGVDMAINSNWVMKLSTEAIDDVQVKTAGIDASAPLGLGAVMNLATSSGTNRFSGSANVVFQSKQWNSNNTPGGTSTKLGFFQPEAAIGGPIERDHWWFLGSYRRTQQVVGLSRTAVQLATLQALSPGFTAFDNETRANNYFAKVTGRISTSHELMGFAQSDLTPNDNNQANYADRFYRNRQGGSGYAIRLSSTIGSSLATRLSAGYNDKANNTILAYDDRPGRNVYAGTLALSGRLQGNGLQAVLDNAATNGQETNLKRLTISGSGTYFRQGWLGEHELEAGFNLRPLLRERTSRTWANGGFAIEDDVFKNPLDPSAGVIPFHRQIYDTTRVPAVFADSSDYGFYVQDAWRPSSRLTLNAGVRIDAIKQTDRIFNLLTQDSTDIGPRFGANYSLTSDGRNTLRASWTRVHESPSQTSIGGGSSVSGVRDLYDTNFDGIFETVLVTPGATALNPNIVFDVANWHQPYVDETTVGYRRQLPGQVSLDIGWIRREFRDRAAGVEINGIYDGGIFRGYRNESLNDIYRVANNVWNWPVYSALELQIGKQTTRLQLIGGYTRQWRHLQGTWQPNDPAAFIQPDAFPDDKGIGSTRGFPGSSLDANSLSGNYFSSLSEWHDHALHFGASYRAPWHLLLATNYDFQSGIWSGPVVGRLAAPDPRFGPPTIQLSNGRAVSNPLATTIRFAGATRSDGQFTLPNRHIWNWRIGRSFEFQNRSVDVAATIFNLTNNGANQWFLFGANQTYSANYRMGATTQLPRAVQLSLRLNF